MQWLPWVWVLFPLGIFVGKEAYVQFFHPLALAAFRGRRHLDRDDGRHPVSASFPLTKAEVKYALASLIFVSSSAYALVMFAIMRTETGDQDNDTATAGEEVNSTKTLSETVILLLPLTTCFAILVCVDSLGLMWKIWKRRQGIHDEEGEEEDERESMPVYIQSFIFDSIIFATLVLLSVQSEQAGSLREQDQV